MAAYMRPEQETSIVWDEEEKVARIYTSSGVSLRKMERLCEQFPDAYRRVWTEKDADGRLTAAKYETVCKYIRFGKPASEARKAVARENAQRMLEKRKEAEQSAM